MFEVNLDATLRESLTTIYVADDTQTYLDQGPKAEVVVLVRYVEMPTLTLAARYIIVTQLSDCQAFNSENIEALTVESENNLVKQEYRAKNILPMRSSNPEIWIKCNGAIP